MRRTSAGRAAAAIAPDIDPFTAREKRDMPTTRRYLASLAVSLALAGAASAQSRSSFLLADNLGGVTVSSPDTLDYTVTESLAPTLLIGSTIYHINSIFGFWVLSDDDDFSVTNSNFLDPDGVSWGTDNSNSGAGAIAGWDTNPNTGITPGDEAVLFHFTSLSGSIEHLGMHIRVDETLPGGGNTAFYVVPAPGAAALLGLGGIAAIRRRR
jgi:hypothetical protein